MTLLSPPDPLSGAPLPKHPPAFSSNTPIRCVADINISLSYICSTCSIVLFRPRTPRKAQSETSSPAPDQQTGKKEHIAKRQEAPNQLSVILSMVPEQRCSPAATPHCPRGSQEECHNPTWQAQGPRAPDWPRRGCKTAEPRGQEQDC